MARSADEPSERPSERHGPSPTQAIRPPGDAEPESDAGLEAARRRRRLVLPQLRSRAAAFHAPRRRVRSVGRGYHLGARVPRREGPGCQTQADQLRPRDRHPRKLRRPGPTLGQAREQRRAGRVPLRPVLAVGLPRQEPAPRAGRAGTTTGHRRPEVPSRRPRRLLPRPLARTRTGRTSPRRPSRPSRSAGTRGPGTSRRSAIIGRRIPGGRRRAGTAATWGTRGMTDTQTAPGVAAAATERPGLSDSTIRLPRPSRRTRSPTAGTPTAATR